MQITIQKFDIKHIIDESINQSINQTTGFPQYGISTKNRSNIMGVHSYINITITTPLCSFY